MNNMNITEWCHHFAALQVQPGDLCIDATAGNGHDTLFLAGLTKESGKILYFDIQEQALFTTQKLLDSCGPFPHVRLILDSHEHLSRYAAPGSVSCITFNLGYLPGGDHRIATHASTTIPAVASGLTLLKKGGLMTLCVYRGGDSGFEEYNSVFSYLKTLDPKKYLVIVSSYYNRPNLPPDAVLIIRL